MQRILRKRTLRELKDHFFRYLTLGMLIAVAVFMIVALLGAAETVIRGVHEHNRLYSAEDGQFRTFSPLSEEQEEEIRDCGVTLERQFYMDYALPDGSCVRIFRNRETIDLLELAEGEAAEAENEIVLERRYCEVHGLKAGDEVTFAGRTFRISGIGTVPDYNSPMKGMTDSIVDSEQFGPGFVSAGCYDALREEGGASEAETYVYSFLLPEGMEGRELRKLIESFPFRAKDIPDPFFQQYYKEQTEDVQLLLDLMDSFLFDDEDAEDFRKAVEPEIHNLQQFVMAEDNMRIDASSDDVMINLYGSLIAGVVILALFAYVMTVFILHGIDEDSTVIGALYAMGVKRQELMQHYILLPTLVSFVSGVIGTVIGHTSIGIRYQMMDTYLYYSVPDLAVRPIPYIIFYGVALPPLIAAGVSYLSIRSRLKRSALSLLRREKKQVRTARIGFEKSPFTARFALKQTAREIRSVITVVAGLYICLVLVWIGIDCWVMCGHIRTDNETDTKYEYMYLYKYPEKTAPEGGVAGYAEGFSKERFGYDLDVTLLGMPEGNPYFEVTTGEAQNEVSVSSAMAQKYGLREGDVFTVEDKGSGRLYAFRVHSVFQYSPGFYAVMGLEAMRELMGQPEDYYNAVFSDAPLAISGGRLYSTVTKEQIRKSGDVFINLMWSMIYFMIGLSSVISLAVMYLMLGVMVDHSAYDISMMKILGYTDSEIRKMYLSGNFLLIAIGAVPAIALSKLTIDTMYPVMISNVACGMDLTMSPFVYVGIYAFIVGSCFLFTLLLTGRVRRIRPAEVLKNAE